MNSLINGLTRTVGQDDAVYIADEGFQAATSKCGEFSGFQFHNSATSAIGPHQGLFSDFQWLAFACPMKRNTA